MRLHKYFLHVAVDNSFANWTLLEAAVRACLFAFVIPTVNRRRAAQMITLIIRHHLNFCIALWSHDNDTYLLKRSLQTIRFSLYAFVAIFSPWIQNIMFIVIVWWLIRRMWWIIYTKFGNHVETFEVICDKLSRSIFLISFIKCW